MTINIKNFLSQDKKISTMGDFQELKDIEGLNVSSVSANLYTKERDDVIGIANHNTKYINTTGTNGKIKNLKSGVKALIERIKSK